MVAVADFSEGTNHRCVRREHLCALSRFAVLGGASRITGVISESFRQRPDARRSRSAFFSFAMTGPDRDDLVALMPREAWGEGSLYHWMLAADTQIVTIGIHPTHCSFSHLSNGFTATG
jgi:aminoglycoside N3'-acetyltransferase